jgi:hypothetical protein
VLPVFNNHGCHNHRVRRWVLNSHNQNLDGCHHSHRVHRCGCNNPAHRNQVLHPGHTQLNLVADDHSYADHKDKGSDVFTLRAF